VFFLAENNYLSVMSTFRPVGWRSQCPSLFRAVTYWSCVTKSILTIWIIVVPFVKQQEFSGKVGGLKVTAVDTTGAGDAFVAGILSQLAADFSLLQVWLVLPEYGVFFSSLSSREWAWWGIQNFSCIFIVDGSRKWFPNDEAIYYFCYL
jgi:hypothetical protein